MKVTTTFRLDLNEHPFNHGETLTTYALRQAHALNLPGHLTDVTAGMSVNDVEIRNRAGKVCQSFGAEWIEMVWEHSGETVG